MDATSVISESEYMPNFKINVKGLLAGVEPAAIVASTSIKKDCQSANHVALDPTPECLYVNANGGRVSIRNPIPFETTYCTDYFFREGGSVTVRANDLVNVLGSFNPDEVLQVEVEEGQKPDLPNDAKDDEKAAWAMLTGKELRLIPQSDPDQYQTLPILGIPIAAQIVDGTPDQVVTLPRLAFTRAVNRILFARGDEEKREKFLYWKLHAEGQQARFIAGTGGMFGIDDIRGSNISDATEGIDLLIPNQPSDVVQKVFSDCSYPNVTIKHFGNRVAFEAENLCLVCVGLNPNIVWPDENAILGRTNLYKFVVPVTELDLAVKGIVATNSDEAKKRDPIHAVKLSFDVEKKLLSLFSDRSTKKALRKVKLSGVWVSENQPSEVHFKCNVKFIAEAVKNAEKGSHVQFELVSHQLPMIMRFGGGDQVQHQQPWTTNTTINAEESFTMLCARIAEK